MDDVQARLQAMQLSDGLTFTSRTKVRVPRYGEKLIVLRAVLGNDQITDESLRTVLERQAELGATILVDMLPVPLLQDVVFRNSPDLVALRCENESMTYGELSKMAHSIAAALRTAPQNVVAVACGRGNKQVNFATSDLLVASCFR